MDKIREEFPVAFMITNRGDQPFYDFFYQIKTSFGCIKNHTFMPDMEDTVSSAWWKTMGPSNKRTSVFIVRGMF